MELNAIANLYLNTEVVNEALDGLSTNERDLAVNLINSWLSHKAAGLYLKEGSPCFIKGHEEDGVVDDIEVLTSAILSEKKIYNLIEKIDPRLLTLKYENSTLWRRAR